MADEKKSDVEKLGEAIAKALKEGLSDGIATGQAYAAEKTAAAFKGSAKNVSNGTQCPECGQPGYTLTGFACQSKHTKMVVLPGTNAKWFRGVRINGVNYVSPNGESISVPADNEIVGLLQAWERSERELQQGRERKTRDFLANGHRR